MDVGKDEEKALKLTIDNLDGNGALDYSRAISGERPVTIERQLNQPSTCYFALLVSAAGLAAPSRNGRVIVTDNAGIVLFTGYIASEPGGIVIGAGTTGAVVETMVSAVSDEILLDRQSVPQTRGTAGVTAGDLLSRLTARVDTSRLTLSESASTPLVGHFLPDPSRNWSQNTREIASVSRSAYFVLSGAINFAPIGSVTHSLSESAGTLQVKGLKASMVKMLANDVTLSGEEEAGAYVSEVFNGDGATSLFTLTREPYFASASQSKPLVDLFQGASINPVLWQVQDGGAHLSLTSAGLTCSGGDGVDGDTTVAAIDQLEIGGALVIEAGGVIIGALSAGILCGLYEGPINTANCFAGFQVTQSGGASVISPIVQGLVAGSSFSPVSGHSYTLRIRTFCKEIQRVLAVYYAVGDGGELSFGGGTIAAPGDLVLEIQDTTSGVSGPSITIYDGSAAVFPALATFAPINSTNFTGSIARVSATEEGAVWVTSQPPGGTTYTRKLGLAAQGADARIERAGKLHFYSGFLPAVNELVTVTYRVPHRAVARLASVASIAGEANGSIPGTSRWIGSVSSPKARSSADCENAAFAMLTAATSRAAAWSGSYTGYNLQSTRDFWPGDLLAVDSVSLNATANLVIRGVTISVGSSSPDLTQYVISFANDWADTLSVKVSSSAASDAWLPQVAQAAVTVLPSLSNLAISSVSSSVIKIAAGVAATSGGGFEVRRRDWHFAPGNDSDLVLRSPVSNFDIPREAAMEQYFIRQYDDATPPNYSCFSSAVIVNVPL